MFENNQLYKNLCVNSSIFECYPDDGPLPGIEDCVVQETGLESQKVFAEEMAGFTEHPAEYINSDDNEGYSMVYIEKTGVCDPECSQTNRRALTASALQKLLPAPSENPDLIIHQSSYAIPEYKNPDLTPGMFPTLFPLGIGGFNDLERERSILFQAHANAPLDTSCILLSPFIHLCGLEHNATKGRTLTNPFCSSEIRV